MKNLLTLTFIVFTLKLNAQIGINASGAAPDPKAMLDINSTSRGFLWPRMTLAQRNAISAASGVTPEGLTVFDTDTKNLWIFKNSAWQAYLPSPWETMGNDIFNNNSGNVAIGGVPNPSRKLQVYGSLAISNPANTRAMVYDPTSVNNLFFSGGDAEIKTLGANSNLNLQKFSDLKLAVGDITPTQKVDIDGQIRIRGGSPAAGNVLTSAADGTGTWQVANDHNHIGQTWTHSALNGLTITNFASADFNVAIRGFANTALRSKGVLGSSSSTTGIGVYGSNTSGGGAIFSPADNSGVSGTAATGIGVYGASTSGRGLSGLSDISDGVYGTSFTGTAIFGEKNNFQTTGSAGLFVVQNATNTSSALIARSEGPIALEIDGGIKVDNTSANKPIFTHVTTAGNISSNTTTLTYPNPLATDFLIVTPNYTVGPVYNPNPIGIYFISGSWRIFNQNLAAMPVGTGFNVMVIRQ